MSSDESAAVVGSCEICGWTAAFLSCLAFGSFGVPIKSKAARSVDIDPLVFQSYKTFMCFVTSWIPILAFGEQFTFSWWGITSGLFWVPGGIATVYAVKTAGLAIGIGIGSSFIVLVSFIWGIFIFDERIHSRFGACFAILCMMAGLFGMSYYSAPSKQQHQLSDDTTSETIIAAAGVEEEEGEGETGQLVEPGTLQLCGVNDVTDDGVRPTKKVKKNRTAMSITGGHRSHHCYEGVSLHQSSDEEEEGEEGDGQHEEGNNGLHHRHSINGLSDNNLKSTERTLPSSFLSSDSSSSSSGQGEGQEGTDDEHVPHQQHHDNELVLDEEGQIVMIESSSLVCCGIQLTKRQSGMLAAVFCGLWGGSIMVPMKFCQSDTSGIHYLVSFAIGASIVTTAIWILRFCVYAIRLESPHEAYEQLPPFHIRKMWLPGGISGLLWSIGNFFSLISVYYLGEGVGYPLVQTSILVSGCWGIFYHKEVIGATQITKWLISSLVTIFGILLLSYEHHEK